MPWPYRIVQYTVAWATPEGWKYADVEGPEFPARPKGMGDAAWEKFKAEWMHAITGPVGCSREATTILREREWPRFTMAERRNRAWGTP
jgi:hypothetical protein